MERDCQHGFIRGKSCTSKLLEVLDHVGSLLDDGKQVDMFYMDMSKAFDKVNHGCLLQKFTSSDLEAASCSGLALT